MMTAILLAASMVSAPPSISPMPHAELYWRVLGGATIEGAVGVPAKAGTVAVEYPSKPPGYYTFKKVNGEPVCEAKVQAVDVIPPGHHAHRRIDGTILIHSDHNVGDPNAHAGVASPWVVIAKAGQAVPKASSPCPTGRCPNQR